MTRDKARPMNISTFEKVILGDAIMIVIGDTGFFFISLIKL